MVVGETDYQSFAVLYLERAQRLSMKLYGASSREPWLCAHLAPSGQLGEPRWTHRPSPPFRHPDRLLLIGERVRRHPCR